MATRPITVILNADQSKKFVHLLPSPSSSKGRILQEAKNKFRSRGLRSIFLQGGAELGDDDDLPLNETKVWVGKGEPYAGPTQNLVAFSGRKEVRIIGQKSFIDDAAIKQLEKVSSLPGVLVAVGMPDLHPGTKFPIGCAIASEGIYPALIGSDVGCGIALYLLSRAGSRTQTNPRRLAGLLHAGLDDPWEGSVTDWLKGYGIDRESDFDKASLGTVGLGNHFAEICTVERIVDEAAAARLKVEEGALYLLVHTGSRGLGASILAHETNLGGANPYIAPGSPHIDEYLTEHDYAVAWAVANRDLVAHRIGACVYGDLDGDGVAERLEKLIDVTHNSVTSHLVIVDGESRKLWVHRKGAAPADKGIVPCPGSRGDFSWLLEATGDGQYNAHSLAHGAGRRYGRKVLHTGAKISKTNLTTTRLGSEVICQDPDLLIEERPEAYKDVKCVVEDMEDKGIGRGVVVLRPIVTYKTSSGGAKG